MRYLDYASRHTKVKSLLKKEKAQVFVCTRPGNTRYLSGSTAPASTLSYVAIPLKGEPMAITSSLEEHRSREECPIEDLRVFSPYPALKAPAKDPETLLRRYLKTMAPAGVLSDTKLTLRLPGVKVKQHLGVEKLRQVKDPQELARMEQAVAAAGSGARFVRSLIEREGVGLTERQVANRLDCHIRERPGVQINSFETIVASGPNAAHSHHSNTARKLKVGDPVICDFGAYVDGYCSDITRTYFAGGEPLDRKWTAIYNLVLEANLAGIAAVRAGAVCKEVDWACRGLLTDSGQGRRFVHGTGHGLGLEVHELPAVTYAKTELLEPKFTITIEPGLYLPGEGGVRIEDDVVVTKDGSRVLTRAAKDIY